MWTFICNHIIMNSYLWTHSCNYLISLGKMYAHYAMNSTTGNANFVNQ